MTLTRLLRTGWLATLLAGAMLAPAALQAASVDPDDDDGAVSDLTGEPPSELLDAARRRAADSGFAWIGGFGVYRGGDDNVFRSPEATARPDDEWGSLGYLRTDLRSRHGRRLLSTLEWSQTRFDSFRQADVVHPSLSNWYRQELNRELAFELDVDVAHQNDDATTITGFDYTRDYSYWRWGAEGVVEWRPAKGHRLRAGVEGVRKDYGEVATLNSLDWTHWRATGSYRFSFRRQVIGVRLQQGGRTYDEEPASFADGLEVATSPAEHHRYRGLTGWYGVTLAHGLRVDASFTWEDKTDLFQGFEDYQARGARLGLGFRPGPGLELFAGGRVAHRDYDRLPADAGATLAYDTRELQLAGRVRTLGDLWLFGDVERFGRDSNLSTGLDYRDGQATRTRLGVAVFR